MSTIRLQNNDLELYINKLLSGKRPLQKLLECKFSKDGRYIVFENEVYSTTTGEKIPLTEGWSLSDILHAGADVLSIGADFIFPGSGAVIDVLNGVSYIIEAQFKPEKERMSLYIMAAITFAFVIAPGPLQSLAIPLKRAIKTGAGFASKIVVKGLRLIAPILDTILLKIPSKIASALKSPLAKKLLGKAGNKIKDYIAKFTTGVKGFMAKFNDKAAKIRAANPKTTKAFGKFNPADKLAAKGTGKTVGKTTGKVETTQAKTEIKAIQDVEQSVFQKTHSVPPPKDINLGAPNSNLERSYFSEQAMPLLTPKLTKLDSLAFNPSNVKVLSKSNVAGREVLEVQIENGQKILMYKSSGANVGTTGKQAGEWFIIPGFSPGGWFIKTKETINLTKGGNKYLTDMSQFLEKNGSKGLSSTVTKKVITPEIKLTQTFFSKSPKIVSGSKVLKKLGFYEGHSYKYFTDKGVATTVQIKSISDDFVEVVGRRLDNNKPFKVKVSVDKFVKKTVQDAWITKGFPLFVKRFSSFLLPDGSNIDYKKLDTLPDVNPQQVSNESMKYLSSEVSSYQGQNQNYDYNVTVQNVQNALIALGYTLKYGADGRYGPETLSRLKQFQTNTGLTQSLGKMDRLTARKLSELLKTKNIQNSEPLQNELNKV